MPIPLFFKTVILIFMRYATKTFKHSHLSNSTKRVPKVQPASLDTQSSFISTVCALAAGSSTVPVSYGVAVSAPPYSERCVPSFFLGACIIAIFSAFSIKTTTMTMDATTGTRDKNKKDYATALGTTMERGPPPSASLHPSPPVGVGKVRCSCVC
jgi:hypothetical protein